MSETSNTKALAIIPRTFQECTAIAEHLSKSSLLPKEMRDKMPNVLVTIMAGQELGLSPMASLRNFHVIEGKPVLSADGMVAVVLGSGKCAYFCRIEGTDTSVTYETLRIGADKPQRCTWTMEMAKRAALHQKDNWRLYPRQMLAARAKAELARDVYEDVLAGCYIDDEVSAGGRSVYDAGDVIEAEVLSETVAEAKPSLGQRIAAASSVEKLTELVPELTTLKRSELADARTKYKDRVVFFREELGKEIDGAASTDELAKLDSRLTAFNGDSLKELQARYATRMASLTLAETRDAETPGVASTGPEAA